MQNFINRISELNQKYLQASENLVSVANDLVNAGKSGVRDEVLLNALTDRLNAANSACSDIREELYSLQQKFLAQQKQEPN